MATGKASAEIQSREEIEYSSKNSGSTHPTGAPTSKDSEFNSDPNVEIKELPNPRVDQQFSHTKSSSTAVQGVEFYQNWPIDFVTFNESSIHSSHLRGVRSEATAMESVTPIPRSPKSSHNPQLSFFLKYHHEAINPAHYCLFYDYHQLCNKYLLAIAERYDPLRYAIVAFSSLVGSARINFAREQAFFYYAITLQEMRLRLGSPPTDIGEYQGMVATILQLSTFDVLSSHSIADTSISSVMMPSAFDT